MNVGPRPLFFGLLAVVSVALLPFTPAEFRWVNWSMAALAMFWAIALGMEELVAVRDLRRRAEKWRNAP